MPPIRFVTGVLSTEGERGRTVRHGILNQPESTVVFHF